MQQTCNGGHLGLHCIATAIVEFVIIAGVEARNKEYPGASPWGFGVFAALVWGPILAAIWL